MATDLLLKLGLVTKPASSAMQKFQRSTEQSLNQITGSFNLMKGAAVAAVGFLAGRELVGAIGDVVEAAQKQQDAVNKLNTAMALTGDYSDDASVAMQTFASKLQQTTAIGDETTIEMLALAKSFGVGNDEAQKMVTAAADLAEISGMSLDSAVRNLGKSMSGLAGELGESVAGLRDLTKEELENGAAIDLVLDKYGGAAASRLNTFSGALEGMQGAFGDLKESIGDIIIENPVLIEIIKQMKTGFESLITLVTENKDALSEGLSDALIGIAEKGPGAIDVLANLALSAIEAARVFNMFSGAVLMGFNDILKAGDDVSSFFKLLSQPINTFVLGMAAVQGTIAEMELSSAKDDLADLKEEFEDMNKALRDGSRAVPIEEYQAMRQEIALAEADVGSLESKVATLAKTGELVAVEIELESKNVEKAVQAQIDARVQTDLDLTEAEASVKSIQASAKNVAKSSVAQLKAARASAKDTKKQAQNVEKLSTLTTDMIKNLKEASEKIGKEILSNVLKGADGAKTAVANLGGAAVEALLPGWGGAATAFLSELVNMSPEQVKAQVEAFVEALPTVISAIADSMPIVAIALAENADKIIIALVQGVPQIVFELVKAAPQIAMALAESVVQAVGQLITDEIRFWQDMFAEIGEINIAEEIADAFDELEKSFTAIARTFSKVSNGLNDFLDGLNRQLGGGDRGFATGGSDLERALGINGAATGGLVGGSGNADSELFRLQPGELVVPDQTTKKLQNFLDGAGNGGDSAMMALLTKVVMLLEQPMSVSVQQEFQGEAIADLILTLNRSNARLA